MEQSWMDGNVVGGVLSEVFTTDMTAATGRCAACGRVAALADTRVFGGGPGSVVRCPACDNVLMRAVEGPGRTWLDLRGLAYVEITTSG
jgi:phage FluMu protein Com